jgi:aldose 1-epimerase
VEPQSGPPDAFNLEPTLVPPGEMLQRRFVIEWSELRSGRLATLED